LEDMVNCLMYPAILVIARSHIKLCRDSERLLKASCLKIVWTIQLILVSLIAHFPLNREKFKSRLRSLINRICFWRIRTTANKSWGNPLFIWQIWGNKRKLFLIAGNLLTITIPWMIPLISVKPNFYKQSQLFLMSKMKTWKSILFPKSITKITEKSSKYGRRTKSERQTIISKRKFTRL
jgi:hypothetical protein